MCRGVRLPTYHSTANTTAANAHIMSQNARKLVEPSTTNICIQQTAQAGMARLSWLGWLVLVQFGSIPLERSPIPILKQPDASSSGPRTANICIANVQSSSNFTRGTPNMKCRPATLKSRYSDKLREHKKISAQTESLSTLPPSEKASVKKYKKAQLTQRERATAVHV